MRPRGVSGGSWEHSASRDGQRELRALRFYDLLAPLGLFCVPLWRPMDFEGTIRLVFLDVFGTTAKTIIINCFKHTKYIKYPKYIKYTKYININLKITNLQKLQNMNYGTYT